MPTGAEINCAGEAPSGAKTGGEVDGVKNAGEDTEGAATAGAKVVLKPGADVRGTKPGDAVDGDPSAGVNVVEDKAGAAMMGEALDGLGRFEGSKPGGSKKGG